MTRIQKALKEASPYSQLPTKAIERYVQTGDAKLLSQLKPSKQSSWWWQARGLVEALAPLEDWTDEDRRLVHALFALGLVDALGKWLNDVLPKSKPDEDIFGAVLAELESRKLPTKGIVSLLSRVEVFAREGKPTSAGRYLLTLKQPELEDAIQQIRAYQSLNLELIGFVIDFAVDRVRGLLPVLLKERKDCNYFDVAVLILQKGGKRFEEAVHMFFRSMNNTWHRFQVAKGLLEYDAAKYREECLAAARASLAASSNNNNHDDVADCMLKYYGREVLNDLVAYLGNPEQGHYYVRNHILTAAVESRGKDALPVIQATLKARSDTQLQLDALTHLIAINDGAQDKLIQSELEQFLGGGPDTKRSWRTTDSYEQLVRAVGIINRWQPARFKEQLWSLLNHKSRPVRVAAARALGQMGEEVIPNAAKLLLEGTSDARLAAVTVLTTVNTPQALKVLEKRLDEEQDDDVRDAMLLGLEAAWAASGRKVTKKDVEARISRAKDKLKTLPATWMKEAKLPALKFKAGKPLDKQAVRYLLYRQSRAKEIRPDIEVKALYSMIDRAKSGDFALEILKGFLATKVDAADRWALTIAGLLGDDRCVPLLNQQIRQWADSNRGKMAEYAVQALSLLGTDAALLTIDALAIRYRTKYKNIGKAAVEAFAAAAENLGITPEELGDRVVPWLGFEAGKPRIIDCGGRKIEARIGLDLKLKFDDVEKNKPVASLPKSAPKEILTEFKELGATLREVAKAQVLRLENLMVRQHRWPIDRWQKLFPVHPLLLPLAVRLVWGVYDDAGKHQTTFRALEDRTFTQASDEPIQLPSKGSIGIVHPLELSDELRKAWLTHLADYEITPPFPQLERPVVVLKPEKADQKTLAEFSGTNLNGMTFKGRAERLGWVRGSVVDAGGISSYYKSFPTAGVEAFVGVDGMYIGMEMEAEIKLQDAFFVKAGSVEIGSYQYDEPANEKDDRVLRFGDVPPIVYSEIVGDLQKIAGKGGAVDEHQA
jgi:hypothetical protein